jgi:hypothetical protein
MEVIFMSFENIFKNLDVDDDGSTNVQNMKNTLNYEIYKNDNI